MRATALLRQWLWRRRFGRFLVVGALNTVFGYAAFFVLLRGGLTPPGALALATMVGVLFNFVTTGRVVFANADSSRLWRFAAIYGLVYLVNAVLLEGLIRAGLDAAPAQALLLAPSAALSYLLSHALVFNTSRAGSLI